MAPVWVAATGGAFLVFLLSASISWDFFFCPPSDSRALKKDIDLITKRVVEQWLENGKPPASINRMLGLRGYLYSTDWRYEGVASSTGMLLDLEIGNYAVCGWEMWCTRTIDWEGRDRYVDQEKFLEVLSPEVRETANHLILVLMDSFIKEGKFPDKAPQEILAVGWWYQGPTADDQIAKLSPLSDPLPIRGPVLVLDFGAPYMDT